MTDANQPPADQSPQEIRAGIERTQQELGDTVEALAAKTDVKGRTKGAIHDAAASVKETVGHAQDAAPPSVNAGASQLSSSARAKPVPYAAAGAFVAGLLVGMLLARRGG